MSDAYRKWNIWVKLVLPVGGFLLLGVFLLLLTWYLEHRAQSREAFASQARVNAVFVRDMNLPVTARLADLLGKVLQMKVCFIQEDGTMVPPVPLRFRSEARRHVAAIPFGQVVSWDEARLEAVRESLGSGRQILFMRSRPDYLRRIMNRSTGWVLAGYLVLSVLILGWVARRIVVPLRELAITIPSLHEDAPFEPVAFMNRPDEVGLLARALQTMHRRWTDERGGRLLAEKHAALVHLAAGLAHEVKNPVAGMAMHLQLLQSCADDEERREVMERLLPVFGRELNRVENLVNQWMYLIQPEPGQLTECSAAELLQETCAVYQAMADYAQVRITSVVDPAHRVRVDRTRMNSVFGNLIRNAVQSMPRGGEIIIQARVEGGCLILTFADTGAGFSRLALERAVELFYSEREGGMGVGLTVSRGIVESHGG
ncbi:MAG: HAMP domain-containing sensor histidine kinase, partial [Kiritimatiellae bacterium]|nr:HAMP domain-containing sensor histidine kinase [Kiritimatiellia bacterium]